MLILLVTLGVFLAPPVEPLLAPLPDAPVRVTGWADARRRLIARSTDLERAAAAVSHADAQWRLALAALLPDAQGSLAVTEDLHDEPVPGSTATDPLWTGRIGVSVPIVDVAAWKGKSAAAAGQRGARAELAEARRDLDQQLADTLIAVGAAERIATLNRDGLRLAIDRLVLGEKAFSLGAATELDVVRIRQDVAVARSALVAGDEQARRAREALGLALGEEGEVGVAPGVEIASLPDGIRQVCRPLDQGEARSDLTAALARVDAARRRRGQARAAYLPTISLAGDYVAWTTDPGGFDTRTWTVSAVLSLPIFDGGRRGAAIVDAGASLREATAVAEDTRRGVRLDVARARRGLAVARDLVAAATEARDLALRLDEMTRRSFTIGRATSVDVVQSASTLRLAELTLAQRLFELERARVVALLVEARCDG